MYQQSDKTNMEFIEHAGHASSPSMPADTSDLQYVNNSARVAVYDDLLSSPRIIDISPAPTREFINALATCIYNSSKSLGGDIPYSIILQVSENFIHSHFEEMVVSILDGGNTIRFADQGPGIADKEKAQEPGYSSATAEMKTIINGVGSGLPIVREYMETKNGAISIEDNIGTGAVVTISLVQNVHHMHETSNILKNDALAKSHGTPVTQHSSPASVATSALGKRSVMILKLFQLEDIWGVKDISDATGIALSSTHAELKKLEEAGMMTRLGKKRVLTDLGTEVVSGL